MLAYLEAAFEDGDRHLIVAALGDVAKSKGMKKVASESGLGRESLYKALSRGGNPRFATVLRVLQVLGIKLYPSATIRPYLPPADPETDWSAGFMPPSSDLFVATGEFGDFTVARASDFR